MCVMSSPAITFSISPDMCTEEPVPEEPKLIRPGRAAGGKRHDDTDRFRRIRLGPAADRGTRHGGRHQTRANDGKPHRLLLVPRIGEHTATARKRESFRLIRRDWTGSRPASVGLRSHLYRSVSYMIECRAFFLVIT